MTKQGGQYNQVRNKKQILRRVHATRFKLLNCRESDLYNIKYQFLFSSKDNG